MFELERGVWRSKDPEVPFFGQRCGPFAELVVESNGTLYDARLGVFKEMEDVDAFSPKVKDGDGCYFMGFEQHAVHVACAECFVEAEEALGDGEAVLDTGCKLRD